MFISHSNLAHALILGNKEFGSMPSKKSRQTNTGVEATPVLHTCV